MGIEMTAELVVLGVVHLATGDDNDAVLPQCGSQFVRKTGRLRREHLEDCAADRRQMLAGVFGTGTWIVLVRDLGLAAQHTHSLHEELVEVRGEDREKLQPFEQGRARVLRLVQDAAIELQPSQITVGPGAREQIVARCQPGSVGNVARAHVRLEYWRRTCYRIVTAVRRSPSPLSKGLGALCMASRCQACWASSTSRVRRAAKRTR
jgi:hypothetical protein